jgi:hypothetical protein
MDGKDRDSNLVLAVRVGAIVVICFLVWTEIELRAWVAVAPFDFPGKAVGLGLLGTCFGAACVVVRWSADLTSRRGKVDLFVLSLLTLWFPLRILLCALRTW